MWAGRRVYIAEGRPGGATARAPDYSALGRRCEVGRKERAVEPRFGGGKAGATSGGDVYQVYGARRGSVYPGYSQERYMEVQ